MGKRQEYVTSSPAGAKEKKGLFRFGLVGAIVTGFLASACCIGPLLVVFLGISGASVLMQFEPYRHYFAVLMILFIGLGFWLTYRRPRAAEKGACCTTAGRKTQQIALWIATILALGMLVVPNLLLLLTR